MKFQEVSELYDTLLCFAWGGNITQGAASAKLPPFFEEEVKMYYEPKIGGPFTLGQSFMK